MRLKRKLRLLVLVTTGVGGTQGCVPCWDTLDLRAGRAPGRGHGDAALGLQLTVGEGKVVRV